MNDYLQYWEIFTTVDNFGIGDFGDLAELVLLFGQTEGQSRNFKIPWVLIEKRLVAGASIIIEIRQVRRDISKVVRNWKNVFWFLKGPKIPNHSNKIFKNVAILGLC